MGVLGWTYDQTLDTPMIATHGALAARSKFVNSILKAAFGTSDEPTVKKEKLTPKLFRNLFGDGK